MAEDAGSFASRWSRRKVLVREGHKVPAAPVVEVVVPVPMPSAVVVAPAPVLEAPAPEVPREPPPTLADVATLNRDSSYARFVTSDVAPEVKNAALKKLFSDPHFNIMDGLDTYIDDYGKPDPLPLSMLRQMTQAVALGLFDDDDKDKPAAIATNTTNAAATAPSALPPPECPPAAPDEDTDLQLQPQHAAGCESPQPGAGQDPRREL